MNVGKVLYETAKKTPYACIGDEVTRNEIVFGDYCMKTPYEEAMLAFVILIVLIAVAATSLIWWLLL